MKYRIIPSGEHFWAVEIKVNDYWMQAKIYGNSVGVLDAIFNTEKEAEEYIDRKLLEEKKREISIRTIEERKRKNPPREYP
tara:strand:+ start:338 stop:580 length:243 start_codon:yes stop_codon:yes gene_type:complete